MPVDSLDAARAWRLENLNPAFTKGVNPAKAHSGARSSAWAALGVLALLQDVANHAAPLVGTLKFERYRAARSNALGCLPDDVRARAVMPRSV